MIAATAAPACHCCRAVEVHRLDADAPCHRSAHQAEQQQNQRHHCSVHVLPKNVDQLLALSIALGPALAWRCTIAAWGTCGVRLHVHLSAAAAVTAPQLAVREDDHPMSGDYRVALK